MTDKEKDKDKNKDSDESEKSEKQEEKSENSDKEPEKTSGDATESEKSENTLEKPEQTESEQIASEQSEPESLLETDSDTSRMEELEAENIRLTAQIEAYKAGFRNETLEDAVLLAENVAKRDGVEISAALQTVAEKYPDWKNTENNSGFKVGAEPPEENKPDESRLNNAFGIRKKKGL